MTEYNVHSGFNGAEESCKESSASQNGTKFKGSTE